VGKNGAGKVRVGIRSEDIRVGPGEASEARVHDVENHGVEKIVTLRVDDHLFKATIPATVAVNVESAVKFGLNSSKLHCFDGATGTNLAFS
jgi:multiple sugar transport system ATP-binding protein